MYVNFRQCIVWTGGKKSNHQMEFDSLHRHGGFPTSPFKPLCHLKKWTQQCNPKTGPLGVWSGNHSVYLWLFMYINWYTIFYSILATTIKFRVKSLICLQTIMPWNMTKYMMFPLKCKFSIAMFHCQRVNLPMWKGPYLFESSFSQ